MFVSELLEVLRACNTLAERAVLTALVGRMNKECKAFPSFATIAKDSGVSLRTAKSVVVELERRGLLARQVESGIRTTYTIRIDHTERPIDMGATAPAPVVAKNATAATADNPSPVEQSGNSGMLPEPPDAKTEGLPAPAELLSPAEQLPVPVELVGTSETLPVSAKRKKSNAAAVQGELLPIEKNGRATRLPKDWRLPRKWGEWAMQEYGFTEDEVRFHEKQFSRHWWSSGKSNAYKVSWYLTWQKWMGDEYQKKQRYNNRCQQKSKTRMAMERLIAMSGGDFEIPF